MRDRFGERAFAAAVLAGVAALAAAAVVVLAYGSVPQPPSLREAPNPAIPGRILYTRTDGCAVSFEPSTGTESVVYCLPSGFGTAVVWLDGSTVAIAQPDASGFVWYVLRLDAADEGLVRTDVTVSTFSLPAPNQTLPTGEIVTVDRDGQVRLVDPRSGATVQVVFDGPGHPTVAGWSPDGRWILLLVWREGKGRQELWVVSRDGTDLAAVATDVVGGAASWWQEGVGVVPDLAERERLLEIARGR